MGNDFENLPPEPPSEESPEKIGEKRGVLSVIISNAMLEGMSVEELNELGEKVTANLSLLSEDTLRAYEGAGSLGLRALAEIVEAKQATLETQRDTDLLAAERTALQAKQRTGTELPPAPESDQPPSEKRNREVGEKSNP